MSEEKDKMPAVVAHSMPAADKTDASKPVSVPIAPKRKHKLEIQIFDIDYEDADKNNGMPTKRLVRNDLDGGKPIVIEVADKAEFKMIKSQYEMCGQTIEVLREIDPFKDNEPEACTPARAAAQPSMMQPVQSVPQQMAVQQQTVQQAVQQTVQKAKPKIITIGDISIKYDGDKVYQKQWVRLTPQEASNFRVVSDSTNKIVSMNDKHLEAQRWVMIEDTESDSSSADSLVAGMN